MLRTSWLWFREGRDDGVTGVVLADVETFLALYRTEHHPAMTGHVRNRDAKVGREEQDEVEQPMLEYEEVCAPVRLSFHRAISEPLSPRVA